MLADCSARTIAMHSATSAGSSVSTDAAQSGSTVLSSLLPLSGSGAGIFVSMAFVGWLLKCAFTTVVTHSSPAESMLF